MNLSSALKKVKKFNSEGIACSLSHLPVRRTSSRAVRREVNLYTSALQRIANEKLDCDITIKLHQLGIYQSEQTALDAARQIAEQAKRHHNFVWIDMMLPDTVDTTLKIFSEIARNYRNAGVCIQAYLQRSGNDLRSVLKDGVPVRLVKGFYNQYDIESWGDVTENYEDLMRYTLLHSGRPAIATHDLDMIEAAKEQIRELEIRNAEFQFFNGVRDELARQLAREGYNVRIYIAFGNLWDFLVDGFRTFDIRRHLRRMVD